MTCPRCAADCDKRLDSREQGIWHWVFSCPRCAWTSGTDERDRRIAQLLTEHKRRLSDLGVS